MPDVRGLSRRTLLAGGLVLGAAACSSSADSEPTAEVEVPVLCRAAWGAAPVRGEGTEHTIERLTVHHTAVELRDNADAPGQLRAIQRDHQRQRWPDIAYHYLIDRRGNIYAGRDPAIVGDTFTPYDPTGHLLVCLLGHFDEQAVNHREADALARILALGAARYDVSPSTIAGHGDYEPSTSCPGRNVEQMIKNGALRSRVEDVLARGTPVVVDVCGAEGRTKVAKIESA